VIGLDDIVQIFDLPVNALSRTFALIRCGSPEAAKFAMEQLIGVRCSEIMGAQKVERGRPLTSDLSAYPSSRFC